MTTKPTESHNQPSSSFASRRAEREAYEAVHGVKPRAAPRALRAGHDADDASRVVITRVQA